MRVTSQSPAPAGVNAEHGEARPSDSIPNNELGVVRTRREAHAVTGKRETRDTLGMPVCRKLAQHLARSRVDQVNLGRLKPEGERGSVW